MNKTTKIALGVAAGVLVLVGIGSALDEETPSAPDSAVTAPSTPTPEPAPEPVPEPTQEPTPESAPEPTPEPTDDPMVEPGDPPREIQLLALRLTWGDLTDQERADVCESASFLGLDAATDAFMSGEGADQFSPLVVRSWIEETCDL